MNKGNSLKKNYLYSTVYQIIVIVLPFLTIPYISRILGADKIGEYSYVLSIATYFGMSGLLGSATYGQLLVSKNRNCVERQGKVFLAIMYSRLFSFGVSMFFYTIITLNVQLYQKMYFVMYLYLLSQFIDITWFFQGIEEFKVPVTCNIVFKIVSTVLIFVLVSSPNSIYVYACIVQGTTMIGNLYLWTKLRGKIKINKISGSEIIYNIKNCLVYFVPTIATIIYASLDKSMIGWLTQSTVENGYYEMSNRIYSVLVAFISALATVLLPRMAYLWEDEKKNRENIDQLINKSFSFISMVICPISMGVFIVAEDFIPLFFGTGYDKCIDLIKIFSIIVFFTSFSGVISNTCVISRGKQNVENVILISSSSVNILMNYIFIKKYGCIGAALSSVISEGIVFGLNIVVSRAYIPLKKWFVILVKYFLGGYIMMLLVWNFKKIGLLYGWEQLVAEILIGILSYLSYLMIVRDENLNFIMNKIIRK